MPKANCTKLVCSLNLVTITAITDSQNCFRARATAAVNKTVARCR